MLSSWFQKRWKTDVFKAGGHQKNLGGKKQCQDVLRNHNGHSTSFWRHTQNPHKRRAVCVRTKSANENWALKVFESSYPVARELWLLQSSINRKFLLFHFNIGSVISTCLYIHTIPSLHNSHLSRIFSSNISFKKCLFILFGKMDWTLEPSYWQPPEGLAEADGEKHLWWNSWNQAQTLAPAYLDNKIWTLTATCLVNNNIIQCSA